MPTVVELRAQAKARGIKVGQMRKAELEKALGGGGKPTSVSKVKETKQNNPNIPGWNIHWKSLAAVKNFFNIDHEAGGKFFEGSRWTYKGHLGQYWVDLEHGFNEMLEEEFPNRDLYSRDLMTFLSPEWKKYIKTKDALTAKKPKQVLERFLDYIDEKKLPQKFAAIKANLKGKKGGRKKKTA